MSMSQTDFCTKVDIVICFAIAQYFSWTLFASFDQQKSNSMFKFIEDSLLLKLSISL